jgi:hypothetical protein
LSVVLRRRRWGEQVGPPHPLSRVLPIVVIETASKNVTVAGGLPMSGKGDAIRIVG